MKEVTKTQKIIVLLTISTMFVILLSFGGNLSTYGQSPPPNGAPVVQVKDAGGNPHIVTFLDQLFIGTGAHCDEYHYHALNGVFVIDILGNQIPDPAPEGCGYGIVGSLSSGEFNNGQIINQPKPGVFVTNQDFNVIPVVVNIYPSSGVDQTQIGDDITNVNKVLSKINAKAVVVKTNTITGSNGGDDGSGGGTAGDGILNAAEREKAREFGAKEVAKLPDGKGLKISFVKPGSIIDSNGHVTPGISVHDSPTAIVEQRASGPLSGATIAHEFGHIFGLHHPTTGSPEKTPGDIMTPAEGSSGRDTFINSPDPDKGINNVGLTDGQIQEINDHGYLQSMSNQGATHSPGQKKHYQNGFVADNQNDTTPTNAPKYEDLVNVGLHSLKEDNFTHGYISLNGLFPSSGKVNANYSLVFNTDANNSTGWPSPIGPFNGIDKEVVLHVEGDQSLGPLSVSGLVLNLTSTSVKIFPLVSTPRLVNATMETDNLDPEVNNNQIIEFDIRKADLNYTADNVPVGVMSRTQEGAVWTVGSAPPVVTYDTTNLVFNTKQYANDPTMTLTKEFAFPGDNLPFAISGLSQNSNFNLVVDNVNVFSNTLNSTGGFAGSFSFPSISTGSHFLIAQDSTGNLAFNFIDPTCNPPASGDWNVTSSCMLANNTVLSGNLIVNNNSIVVIPNGISLNVNFLQHHLSVKTGGGVLIKLGGKIS